ncbi:MAG TPA: nitroreductase family deazaflavin-dependent oxidoreductase [Ktedonobacterales bacterium]
MATTSRVPWFVPVGNKITMALARAGIKLSGPGVFFGNYPMYLLTVRGRKTGQPRTVLIAAIQRDGKRYVSSPYGIVDWVRNLRVAGKAVLTRGRRSQTVRASEVPPSEAALILREEAIAGNPFIRFFGVNAHSTLEEFERATVSHPLFLLAEE